MMSDVRAVVPVKEPTGDLDTLRGGVGASDRLDLNESIGFFGRWLKLILGVTAAVALGAAGISMLLPKVYRAEASVMLTRDASNAVQPVGTQLPQVAITDELIDTQMQIITSRDMAERVVDSLGLGRGQAAEARSKEIIRLRKNLTVRRSGESYALAISFDSTDPAESVKVANEFARQYSNWQLSVDQQRNQEARRQTEQKLAVLQVQAQKDMQALQEYRIANNLLSTSGASLAEQEISNYEQEVAKARAEAAQDEARLQTALGQLRSGSSGDDVGEALDSPVILALRAQESQLAAQVANLASRYGPNHPELIRTRNQLGEVRERIQAEIGRVVSNLRARQNVSQQRLASLTASLNGARGKLTQNNSAMVGLSDLERAAAASQGIYDSYLNSYKQQLAAEGGERANARVLSWATLPKDPISPNIKLNFGLALVVGLGLGTLAAYVAQALFQGITTPDELEKTVGERFLASIPLLESTTRNRQHAVVAVREDPRSIFAESFRALAASIDQVTHGNDQVIAITSALPNEGKTVMSCCLAHTLATSGLRTILIDCDLRRRGISRLLDMKPHQQGLIEVLDGSTPLKFDDSDGDYVFCILPLKPSEDEPEHLLTGQAFVDLIERLRGSFDRIILDLPPVLPIAAASKLASRADAVVVATRWRTTSSFALRAALRRLPRDMVNVVGVALSQVDMRRMSWFGRHDPAFYYKKYSEYYS